MLSPGSITIASRVVSSPMMEQLHCKGPTGRISWIMALLYDDPDADGCLRCLQSKR